MSTGPEGRELVAGPDDAGRRLDKVLRAYLDNSTLSEIYSGLRRGRIRVNGHKAAPELRLDSGDRIFLHSSMAVSDKGRDRPAVPEAEGLREIAEMLILATEDLIFVNKPRGELSQGPDRTRAQDTQSPLRAFLLLPFLRPRASASPGQEYLGNPYFPAKRRPAPAPSAPSSASAG